MNDREWSRLRALFDEVVSMSDEERRAYLDGELRGEPELRSELSALLASDAAAGGFLRASQAGKRGPAGGSLGIGSTVGNFRLLELLGEGGFGVVYLAEQLRPIQRRVALKLVKPGMDTKQVIARFETERQALALMDHSGIAQVFDAGETEAGRPFIAMEYVPGIPITTFCDEERLRLRERLDLFLLVCDAMQHAHQKGVIHRDLKPSNVLVARRDGGPALKVIDFGIVKAAGAGMDDRSVVTREGVILGTLGYMSPEQAGAIEAETDTRSDIYSLGVLLYELLSGEPPFEKARFRRVPWSEAARVIREEDPPSMTARLTRAGPSGETAGDKAARVAEIARRRSTDERALLRDLKGELEWITLRALEKDPDRRYASASELSADVRRHLANEAVLARAPTTIYRARKFARRHRVGVAAAALVLASIVAGGVAAGVGFARARRAERSAQREAASARQVADFVVDLFDASTPDRSLGETITARTLLDLGARRIEGDAIEDPLVRARFLSTLASAHWKLGLFDEAVALQQGAVEATRAALGADSPEVGRELSLLAECMLKAGKLAGVDSVIDRSVGIFSNAKGSDPSGLAGALHVKGKSLLAVGGGNLAPADSFVRLAIRVAEAQARPDTATLVDFYTTKSVIDGNRGDRSEQEEDLLRALPLAVAALGERSTQVFTIRRSLAQCYAQQGRPAEARRYADEALRLARVIFTADHPSLALALSAQGEALFMERKLEDAVASSEEALAILRKSYRGDHPNLAWELFTQGTIYRELGRLDLSIERFREAADMRFRLHGPNSSRAAEILSTLASTFDEAGDRQRGDSAFQVAIPKLEQAVKTRPHGVGQCYVDYANHCRSMGRTAEADTFYTRAEALFGSRSPFLGACLTEHAYLRALQGRHVEADSMMRTGIAACEEVEEDDSPYLAAAYVLCAATRARAGNADGAVEALGRAARGAVTAEYVGRYRELASLRSRPDYPEALR